VPDVVLGDFPVGFSIIGGSRFFDSYKRIEKAISGGEFFVTYSDNVKWRTLVQRYHVSPEAIQVIPHGANRLDDLVFVSGFPDNDDATNTLCRQYFRAALPKAQNHPNPSIFGSDDLRFIFYASQFRPNKNVITLLRAYEYLLRRQYVGQKLVLTGNVHAPEIIKFITSQGLINDVLFLHGLSAHELAACYRLADLAVNPSLSEGGCPFTYTEAVSVGTPVVMARIAVTEEVLVDPELQAATLFDPYDWRSMAEKIKWALENRDALYARQRKFYDEVLVKRTWRHVVDDYIAILDAISRPAA
jgi:glycosyltransferase involved in cell wall biosynthesis